MWNVRVPGKVVWRSFNVLLVMVVLLSLAVGLAPVAAQEGAPPEGTPPANDPLAPMVQEPEAVEPAQVEIGEGPHPGGTCEACAAGESQSAGAGLTLYATYNIRGSYTWAAVGMRNRGYGTAYVTTPPGSTTYKAFLFWTILAPREGPSFKIGKFAGHTITGTLIGAGPSPCWSDGTGTWYSYSYRADVTSYVTGSGYRAYSLTDFQSKIRDGRDPWNNPDPLPANAPDIQSPTMEGATLLVIYEKSTYPQMLIKLYNGHQVLIGTSYTLNITGFTASNPVGAAFALFIGADGQADGTETTKFNGSTLTYPTWDGWSARQNGPNYRYGNLWDTEGQQVGRFIRPGATSATAEVSSGSDCLVWVAFVFSLTSGNVDTDGDALLDGWEINGYDDNGDGVFDFYLPGAPSLLHKDIYVETDWMADTTHSHKPRSEVITRSQATFAGAPVSNPDGSTGINIWIDDGRYGGGNSVAHQSMLGSWNADGSYNWSAFDTIKNANFNSKRRRIFHYCLFAHNIHATGISGISRGIPASDFIVSLGSWTDGVGSADEQTGTFIHELGHNLGLKHGGDDHANYEPNYLSIMNYSFQTRGLYFNGAWGRFDYQRFTLPCLNENSLTESVGLNSTNANNYGTTYYCPSSHTRRDVTTANGPIDWNCSGGINTSAVAADINKDDNRTTLCSQNNWASIVYDGGSVGLGMDVDVDAVLPASTLQPICLSWEEWQLMEANAEFVDNSRTNIE